MPQDSIIQIRLVNTNTKDSVVLYDGSLVKNGTVFPKLVRQSAVQSLIDQGIVEQVPATSSIPLNAVFGDIVVTNPGTRVTIPIGPERSAGAIKKKSITVGLTEYKVDSVTPELNYYPVTFDVNGSPVTYALEYSRFSSTSDSFPDAYSFATLRTNGDPTPRPLDYADNFKDEYTLKPGQILNCRLSSRITDLEAKGLITIQSVDVTPVNVPTPQSTIGPSPQGLPFPPALPDPLFNFVNFYGWINSVPQFPQM